MRRGNKFVSYGPSIVSLYNQYRELILKESSMVSIDVVTGKVLAVGNDVPSPTSSGDYTLIGSPLKNGTVAEFEMACEMFKFLFNKASVQKGFFKPKIAVCVNVDLTMVEAKVFAELFLCVGFKEVLILEKTFEKALTEIPESYKFIVEIL